MNNCITFAPIPNKSINQSSCIVGVIQYDGTNIPENTVVYRGINTRIPSNWKVGDSFYFPGFISTSLSKEVAKNFGNYILVITLHGKGYKGVERISYYPNEKEVLICPYSRYVISKISGNYCYLDRYNN